MSMLVGDLDAEVNIRKISWISVVSLQSNYPKDEKQEEKEAAAPNDKYNLVHVIFFFFGVGALVPSSFFLVAQDYWMYKFRDPNFDQVDLNNKTVLQKNFVSISGIAHTIPGILITLLSSYYGHKINIYSRLNGCMGFLSAMFVIYTAFIKINTDTWQLPFFIITMGVSTAITMACHVLSVTTYPLISRFPQTYMKSQMYGSAASGLLSALLEIFCLWLGGSSTTVALIYFSCGTFILLICTACAVICKRVPRFVYYLGDAEADTTRPTLTLKEMRTLAWKLWPKIILTITGLLTAGTSGSNITTLIVSEYYDGKGVWARKYFEPVVTFLWPDILGLVGRYFARPLMTRKNAPYFVLVDALRILTFNPLFLFCNAQPRKHIPVLFPHDWEYILVVTVHSLVATFFGMSSFMSMENLVPGQAEQGFLLMASFGGVVNIFSSMLASLWVNVL